MGRQVARYIDGWSSLQAGRTAWATASAGRDACSRGTKRPAEHIFCSARSCCVRLSRPRGISNSVLNRTLVPVSKNIGRLHPLSGATTKASLPTFTVGPGSANEPNEPALLGDVSGSEVKCQPHRGGGILIV